MPSVHSKPIFFMNSEDDLEKPCRTFLAFCKMLVFAAFKASEGILREAAKFLERISNTRLRKSLPDHVPAYFPFFLEGATFSKKRIQHMLEQQDAEYCFTNNSHHLYDRRVQHLAMLGVALHDDSKLRGEAFAKHEIDDDTYLQVIGTVIRLIATVSFKRRLKDGEVITYNPVPDFTWSNLKGLRDNSNMIERK